MFVSITFEDQKNGQKNQTRTQQRTDDPVLCPVKAWLLLVLRIFASPNTNPHTTVNAFYDHTRSTQKFLSQHDTNLLLRQTCAICSEMHFGYRPQDIGSHSLRSGAAMALFLAQESVHRIMILGRWSSDAFLDYIRPQVQEWTSGMSRNMLLLDDFHTATDSTPTNANNIRHSDDPCQRFDSRAFTSNSSFNGPNSPPIPHPRLHLFH
jgi:hypothetical protein